MAFQEHIAPSVLDEIGPLPASLQQAIRRALDEISVNPFPRTSGLTQGGFEISEETTISGEEIFVFSAPWLDGHALVYEAERHADPVTSGDEGWFLVFFLR